MKKREDNKRRDQTQREKTRGDQKRRCKNKARSQKEMDFFEPLGIFLTLVSFDQTSFLLINK